MDRYPSQRNTSEIGTPLGEGRASERMPKVMKRDINWQSGYRQRGLPDLPVVVVTAQQPASLSSTQDVVTHQAELCAPAMQQPAAGAAIL
jgi:hypothetical protein